MATSLGTKMTDDLAKEKAERRRKYQAEWHKTHPRSEKEKERSRARSREWYLVPGNKERMLARNKEWARRNPDKMREYSQRWRAKQTAERKREIWVRSKYQLTEAEYEIILRHNGKCDACKTPIAGRKQHIDHDHANGKVRGILCGSCNQAAGLLQDNPERASALARYLKRVTKKSNS